MAAKFTCDGCDNEIQSYDAAVNQITVSVTVTAVSELFGGKHDFCTGCRRYYLRIVNPKSWPRTVQDAARAEGN